MNTLFLALWGALAALVLGVALGVVCGRKAATAAKKPRKTSNIVLVVLGGFLLTFIITMIVTFWVKGAVPDTLIQYTLGAGGVEAVALAAIKIGKTITGEKPGESEDI